MALKQSRRCNNKSNPFNVQRTHDLMKPKGQLDFLLQFIGNPDPSFRVGDFEKLFVVEERLGLISFLKFRFMTSILPKDECDVLWFLNKEGRQDLESECVPLELTLSDSIFELRCITSSCQGDPMKPDDWDGSVWMRYGTTVFDKWWTVERRGKNTRPLRIRSLQDLDWRDVDMAIYVRKWQVDLEEYRREYLKYIGGQNRVGCECHDVPLITSPLSCKGGRKCGRYLCLTGRPDRRCEAREEFECPVEKCTTRICKSCFSGSQ